ncbi:MAG: response regulator transcription factor [Rhodospirillales bacterium]|nr:response regulator transcription factor [Rhodospirillales bacterium]MDH3912626.1 response regulator transcription factor [Rhodospirillales bacterium]MDH3918858.1 response regulator transcription factor [Rhodospirillales bacterium]MDH3969543.1 response regulator transcription factor [Rhodospirillales bacterium]
MTKILVIEDEAPIRERVVKALNFEGYEAYGGENGREGLELAKQHQPDLIIADIMMPELGGQAMVSLLRDEPATRLTPIIMVTALDQRVEQRRFMELGVDDYITKPFDLAELLGAVQAQLRKQTWRDSETKGIEPEPGTIYTFAGWRYEADRRHLSSERGGRSALTGSEAQLLITLLEHANSVISREALFDALERTASSPFDRTIDVLVSRVRRKIEDNPRDPKVLLTVRNTGYMLNAEVVKTTDTEAA